MFKEMLAGSNGQALDDDRPTFEDVMQIGIAGLTHCVILIGIISWRAVCFVIYTPSRERRGPTFVKRLIFHLLLWLAIASDIPMYSSFVVTNSYQMITYGFHKLESGWMFVAYSVVVSDWLAVLRDINEDSNIAYTFKWWALFVSNVVVIAICLSNFLECLFQSDFSTFTAGPIYTMGLFSQFSSVLLLTVMILHSGLKLAFRLWTATEGVRGSRGSRRPHTKRPSDGDGLRPAVATPSKKENSSFLVNDTESPSIDFGDNVNAHHENQNYDHDHYHISINYESQEVGKESTKKDIERLRNSTSSGIEVLEGSRKRKLAIRTSRQAEFLAALRRLNIVMAACVLCNLLCITMLALNFAVGYESSAKEYIFNVYVFWACYAWIPLWGPVIALLYLVTPNQYKRGYRRGGKRRRHKHKVQQPYRNPHEDDIKYESNEETNKVVLRGDTGVGVDVDGAAADDLNARLLPPIVNGEATTDLGAEEKRNAPNINIIGFERDGSAHNSNSNSHGVSPTSSMSEHAALRGSPSDLDMDDASDYSSDDSDSSDQERYGYDYEYHYDSSSLASNSTVTDSVTSSILSDLSYRQYHRGSFSHGLRRTTPLTGAGYMPPGSSEKFPSPTATSHETSGMQGGEVSDRDRDRERSSSAESSPQNIYLSSGQGGGSLTGRSRRERFDDYAYVATRKSSSRQFTGQ